MVRRRGSIDRPGFRDWVDAQQDPQWPLMPLTHITKGLVAHDIFRSGRIEPTQASENASAAYFFYGRPAYRVAGDEVVKMEAACPYCFVFDQNLINRAAAINAFDSGAFEARMYKHVLIEEFQVDDFSLESTVGRPNKLISVAFGSQEHYFNGDIGNLAESDVVTKPWELEGRAYLELLRSPGRNEPDDRICSIEVVFGDPVPLSGNLRAVVVPHTHWSPAGKSPWLSNLDKAGVHIAPYLFIPGRHPEHYHALLENAVKKLYEDWEVL